jgi:Domain of unknown function, B. Theta Gene description (DUF3871)
MEYIINNKTVLEQLPALSPNGVEISSSSQPFIEANTIPMSISDMQEQHIIPVWATSNEPLISHSEFIETMWEFVHKAFPQERVLKPNIRVSHPIKGRIPEAKHKAAKDLEPWEQTIYYERMMFVIEIPTIKDEVNGNLLSLTIGGVKSYNLDNLYSKRAHGDQHFQLFIGFQNKVCCNLCVWSDGLKEEVGVKSRSQLRHAMENMLGAYNGSQHLSSMRKMNDIALSETEFAQLIGRARMHKHMPDRDKKRIPEILLGDQQLNAVVHDYYKDHNFGNESGGDISLWRFYNLLTGANKSTYIDSFLERGVNAHNVTQGLLKHKSGQEKFWYLG